VAAGAGTLAVYVDGILQPLTVMWGAQPGFFGDEPLADNMTIGAIQRDTVMAEGDKVIDELGIYNRILSAQEIQTIYQGTPSGDTTPPTITYSGNAGIYTVDQMVNITCSAYDGQSGIASSTCRNIGGPAYTFPLGINTFSATAADKAGNTGYASTSFTVKLTYDSLGNLVKKFVTKSGTANSLLAKLDNARAAEARGDIKAKTGMIGAFINEVQAQTGKAISPENAIVLIALAKAI
jgi:hypothetical protein